jgi:hypothetical protein
VPRPPAAPSAAGWRAPGPESPGHSAGPCGRRGWTASRAASASSSTKAGARRPAGGPLRWRSAGIAQAAAEPSLPFFLEWGEGTPFPGAGALGGSPRICRLELRGDAGRLDSWLGRHELPVEVRAGVPALARIVLATGAGEVVVEALPGAEADGA